MKKCPYCQEMIPTDSVLCPICSENLSPETPESEKLMDSPQPTHASHNVSTPSPLPPQEPVTNCVQQPEDDEEEYYKEEQRSSRKWIIAVVIFLVLAFAAAAYYFFVFKEDKTDDNLLSKRQSEVIDSLKNVGDSVFAIFNEENLNACLYVHRDAPIMEHASDNHGFDVIKRYNFLLDKEEIVFDSNQLYGDSNTAKILFVDTDGKDIMLNLFTYKWLSSSYRGIDSYYVYKISELTNGKPEQIMAVVNYNENHETQRQYILMDTERDLIEAAILDAEYGLLKIAEYDYNGNEVNVISDQTEDARQIKDTVNKMYMNMTISSTYFSNEFMSLYEKMKEIENQGYIVFDTHPLIDAQDYGYVTATVSNISFTDVDKAECVAKVDIGFYGYPKQKKNVKLIKEDGKWKIDNIDDLKQYMSNTAKVSSSNSNYYSDVNDSVDAYFEGTLAGVSTNMYVSSVSGYGWLKYSTAGSDQFTLSDISYNANTEHLEMTESYKGTVSGKMEGYFNGRTYSGTYYRVADGKQFNFRFEVA